MADCFQLSEQTSGNSRRQAKTAFEKRPLSWLAFQRSELDPVTAVKNIAASPFALKTLNLQSSQFYHHV